MGDGLQLLVGGCLMNGSGEPEWEEKDVPKVSKRSGQESVVLGCGRRAALESRPCGHQVLDRQTHLVWQYAQMSWTRSWNVSSEPSKETPERHRE